MICYEIILPVRKIKYIVEGLPRRLHPIIYNILVKITFHTRTYLTRLDINYINLYCKKFLSVGNYSQALNIYA